MRSKLHGRDQRGTQAEHAVPRGVLKGVACFVGSNGCCSDAVAIINVMAEVDGFVDGVIVVGEHA